MVLRKHWFWIIFFKCFASCFFINRRASITWLKTTVLNVLNQQSKFKVTYSSYTLKSVWQSGLLWSNLLLNQLTKCLSMSFPTQSDLLIDLLHSGKQMVRANFLTFFVEIFSSFKNSRKKLLRLSIRTKKNQDTAYECLSSQLCHLHVH